MSESIFHTGVIRATDSKETVVEIMSASACASCHAAGLCTASEAKKKEIVIPADPSETWTVGEEVDVMLSESLGMKAVLISYVVPLVILLILVVSLSYTSMHELLIGLIGLCAMAVYYLVIYFIRDSFSKEYVFSIRKR